MNGLEEKMTWKLKKKWSNWTKNHILDLFISVPIRDIKRKFIRYQSVIIANIGFAPQILQKLWASENSPTHYLDSWVKVWATPSCLKPQFSKEPFGFLNWNFTCNLLKHKGTHEASFVKIRDYDLQTSGPLEPEWPHIYPQKQFACTILLLHFVKISYYIMRRYYITQRFFVTFRVPCAITFREKFVLHYA